MNIKAKHALRIVIGGYLTFLGISLFKQAIFDGVGNVMLGACLGPVFAVIGLAYAINALRKVLKIRKDEIYGVADETEAKTESEVIEEKEEL